MADSKAQETQVELARQSFDTNDMRAIASWDDAIALLQREGVALFDASTEIGDGFVMCENKSTLIDVPFVMMKWSWGESDFIDPATGEKSDTYLVARVVTAMGDKLVITDGGSGIAAQVRDWEDRTGLTAGLVVQRGLRKSEYDNEFGHGVTYYLNV